jgi:hypothetical protein
VRRGFDADQLRQETAAPTSRTPTLRSDCHVTPLKVIWINCDRLQRR